MAQKYKNIVKFFAILLGSLQSYRRHPQSDEYVQKDSSCKDYGQLLWQTCISLLEGWSLLIPCRCTSQTVSTFKRNEEEHHSRRIAEVRYLKR